MSVELSHLISEFERLWPLANADEWDAPGLVCGGTSQRVARVLLSVDVTNEILAEAKDGKFDLVLAHHPFLLRSVQTLAESTSKGSLISDAIRSDVAIYAAHTNADVADQGVSQTLAEAFGLSDVLPLVPLSDRAVGHGRLGKLSAPVSLGDFARMVAKVLPSTATGVRVAGDYDQLIQTVALCAGAGDSFIGAAFDAHADVYVTSDLRHHPAQDARERSVISEAPMALIDVSHWASEWLWLEVAAAKLATKFPDVQVVVSQIRTDPWEFTITQ